MAGVLRLMLVAAVTAIVWTATAPLEPAEARPEACPSFHPMQPCTWVPTEDGAYSASGDWEIVIVEGDEVTRLSGSTELGEIVSEGGLPKADRITVRALSPGSWIVGGSTDCSECEPLLGHGDDGDDDGDGGDDGDEPRRPGRSGEAPGHDDDREPGRSGDSGGQR